MSSLVIRPASSEDAAAIDAAGYEGALHHHRGNPTLLAAPAPELREWSESALASANGSTCLVAEVSGQVVGYVHAVLVSETRPTFVPHKYGRIEAVAVLPENQSRGIGSKLLRASEEWLSRHGCDVVRLSVFASNHRASQLYEARGYSPLVTFMQRSINNEA